jgi:hypothetical protein
MNLNIENLDEEDFQSYKVSTGEKRDKLMMDDDDIRVNETREAGLRTMEFFFRGLRHLAVQKGSRSFSFDCFLLALGQGKIIGMLSAKEVARYWKKTKAAASECVDDFQKILNIEEMPGQRSSIGKVNMAKARNGQLK